MRDILDKPEQIIDIMRDVADAEIVPRFRALAAHEIIEKAPGDLVTIADRSAEHEFSKRLPALLPGSVVVGEEGVAADPTRMQAIDGGAPVWIVDPVDGTHNFAHGNPPFTVIVALVRDRVTLGGWIIDPLSDDAVYAIRNEGTRYMPANGSAADVRRVPPKKLADARMVAGYKLRQRIARAANDLDVATPIMIDRYRCVGREYMDIAIGKVDLARYGGRLKPWDHAAGCLIIRECGGRADVMVSEQPFEASSQISSKAIGVVGSSGLWPTFHDLISRADTLA